MGRQRPMTRTTTPHNLTVPRTLDALYTATSLLPPPPGLPPLPTRSSLLAAAMRHELTLRGVDPALLEPPPPSRTSAASHAATLARSAARRR